MVFTAQQFPHFFVKKHIVPNAKYSELWRENTGLLAHCNKGYVDHYDELGPGKLFDLKNESRLDRAGG